LIKLYQLRKPTIVVPRISEDETTVAIVLCSVEHNVSDSEVLRKIRNAVELWLATPEGQEDGWIPSCEDFNWGDLSMNTHNGLLIEYLEAEGVFNLDIKCYVSLEKNISETYDTRFEPRNPGE